MALIKCSKCGGTVSDKADSCPHCGASLSTVLRCEECNHTLANTDTVCPECGHHAPWARKCPDCGNYVLPTEEACPECGCDMGLHFGKTASVTSSSEITKVIEVPQAEKSGTRDKTSWIITLGIIVALLIGGGMAWYSLDNNVADDDEKVEAVIPLTQRLEDAKSKEEVEILINGTTWHCTENLSRSEMSGWIQVKFNNGSYTCYTAAPSDGQWTQSGSGTYSVSEGRFSNTGEYYVCIEWECPFEGTDLGSLPHQFRFFPKNGQIDVGCHSIDIHRKSMSGNWYQPNYVERGTMTLGEYYWN